MAISVNQEITSQWLFKVERLSKYFSDLVVADSFGKKSVCAKQ